MNLEEFKINALRNARRLGLTDTNPITVSIMGNTGDGFAVARRELTVSYAEPQLYNGPVSQLWMNAHTLEMMKSSNWREPNAPSFEPVPNHSMLFQDA